MTSSISRNGGGRFRAVSAQVIACGSGIVQIEADRDSHTEAPCKRTDALPVEPAGHGALHVKRPGTVTPSRSRVGGIWTQNPNRPPCTSQPQPVGSLGFGL